MFPSLSAHNVHFYPVQKVVELELQLSKILLKILLIELSRRFQHPSNKTATHSSWSLRRPTKDVNAADRLVAPASSSLLLLKYQQFYKR